MSEKPGSKLRCLCGQLISRWDVMRQGYYRRQGGLSYVYIKYRCTRCKKLGEHLVKEDEWRAGLLSDSPKEG